MDSSLHHTLAATFAEDGSQIHKGNSREITSAFRWLGLTILKSDTTIKDNVGRIVGSPVIMYITSTYIFQNLMSVEYVNALSGDTAVGIATLGTVRDNNRYAVLFENA